MSTNTSIQETGLVESVICWLSARLPPDWAVAPSTGLTQEARIGTGLTRLDAAIDISGPNSSATLAVEVKQSFGPRDVDRLLGGVSRALRALAPYVSILVVASWLSPRTRQLLAAEEINYVDLTGNALIKLNNPALFIQSNGADRDPSPTPRGKARVRGPRASRLVRLLVDVRPTYGVREIAVAAELNPGYTSRLLDTLDDEALVERSPRGRVESVDIPALLRRWAESYDVFRTNPTRTFIAPKGAARALSALSGVQPDVRGAVTGSFAAVRLAPVAAPALLVLYSDSTDGTAEQLGLIPADEGANVAILQPFDTVVWERVSEEDGQRYVAPSQLVVDCLTGNGRMPAEGEAVLAWMVENESQWRVPSLDSLSRTKALE